MTNSCHILPTYVPSSSHEGGDTPVRLQEISWVVGLYLLTLGLIFLGGYALQAVPDVLSELFAGFSGLSLSQWLSVTSGGL